MEIVYELARGGTLWREEDTLVLEFSDDRDISSTSAINGGIRRGIKAIFNQTAPPVTTAQELPGGSVEGYLAHIASLRGLDPKRCSGLLTAASQKNAAISYLTFRQLEVLAVATAGVDHNGGQAGDPASYYEENGQFHLFNGTINILLSINAHLPSPAMLKAIITATEAKSAALLELLAPSCYSVELATGSGTDGVIVASDPSSTLILTDAGHHSKLGELIGRIVREAVKKALVLETGFTPQRQLNILARLKRFNLDEAKLWDCFLKDYPSQLTQEEYGAIMAKLAEDPKLVALFSSVLHLADQVRWGLLPGQVAWQAAQGILSAAGMKSEIGFKPTGEVSEQDIVKMLIRGFNELVLEGALKLGWWAGKTGCNN